MNDTYRCLDHNDHGSATIVAHWFTEGMKREGMEEHPLMEQSEGVPLFYPHISKGALSKVEEVISGRWIGQGPRSEEFERRIGERFCPDMVPVAVNSGTSAIHLAYLLAGIKAGDEVLTPVFTCTATNIPLLYLGAKPVFVDVDLNTLNVSVSDMRKKVTSKTKAVVVVDYGGVPCDYQAIRELCDENNLILISDAAHSLGTRVDGNNISSYCDYIMYSFQAIKTITTADGGLLGIRDKSLASKAKRLRWFGIDRESKQKGVWQNDIWEVGYKYQLSDLSAAIGLANLEEYDKIMDIRRSILSRYYEEIDNSEISLLPCKDGYSHRIGETGAWLMTIRSARRVELMNYLRAHKIESAQVHYRNDRYSIFQDFANECPNMDRLEDEYLVIPCHTRMDESDVTKVIQALNSF